VIAETQCESETVFSNEIKDIGFRSPFGTVTGKVSYSGGTAVEDVKITAAASDLIQGTSLLFDGNDTLSIAHKDDLNLTKEFLVETWLQPTAYDVDFDIIHKPGEYRLRYVKSSNQYVFTIHPESGDDIPISFPATSIPINNFTHLAVQLYGDSLKVFRNGDPFQKKSVSSTLNIKDNTENITLGEKFKGYLTEFRFWTKGKSDALIKRDFQRRMKGNEQGLKIYLRTNEGEGRFAYDGSNVSTTGTFNEHHA